MDRCGRAFSRSVADGSSDVASDFSRRPIADPPYLKALSASGSEAGMIGSRLASATRNGSLDAYPSDAHRRTPAAIQFP